MKFLTQKEYHFKKPVITMGNFDGIHIGHQKLLHLLKRRADEIGGESIVVTYYHHPFETLHKKPYPYLLTEKDKKEDLLLQMGIDHVLFLKFDDEIADMSAQTFLENILIGLLHPVEIFVGYDTHFGRNRCGDFKYLKNNEEKYGYITHHIPPVKCSGQIISSTMIRKCISDGMVETAKQYLGRFYSIEGKIVHGEGIGRTIGFPTINLQPNDAHKLIPRDGIYFTFLNDANGNQYYGLTNIGYSPTIKQVMYRKLKPIYSIMKGIYMMKRSNYSSSNGLEMKLNLRARRNYSRQSLRMLNLPEITYVKMGA